MINSKTIFIITCALFLAQCQSEEQQHEGHDHAGSAHQGEEGHHGHGDEGHLDQVHLTAEKQQVIDLSYDTLSSMNLSEAIKTNGHIRLAPDDQSMISSLIEGRVKKVNVIEGDYVQKGETLAILEGMAITKLQQDYLANKAELPYLKKEYERKKKLLDKKVGAASALQKAKANYKQAQANMRSQKKNLKMLNILEYVQAGQVSPTVPVVAPFSGHIGDVSITKGQYVERQQPLIEVMNTDHAHLELQVFEKNIGTVKEGQRVSFTYANQAGDWWEGEIFRVGRKFHKENQSIRVHAHIHDEDQLKIIPGIYINARIQAKTGKSFALPEEAVIRDGKQTFVFAPVTELKASMDQLEQASGKKKKFVRLRVETGATDGGFISIRSFNKDIPTDIRFVTKGASTLQAEMKKSVGGHQH